MKEAKKTIKVCILMPCHWSFSMGGAEYQSKCIISSLLKSGNYEIYFLARNVSKSFQTDDFTVYTIKNVFGVNKGKYFADAFSILDVLKRIKPDVIYQRVGTSYTGIAAYYAKKYRAKMIWHIARDDDVTPSRLNFSKRLLSKFIEKKFLEYGLRHATLIVAQTGDQTKLLKENYDRSTDIVIKNFHPFPETESNKSLPVKVVWVANIKDNKRPEIFLSLAESFTHLKNVEFIMIGAIQGNSAWKKKMLSLIDSISNINYLGSVSQAEVNNIIAESHIFINTSKLEGFPNTFIQAWMRSVPVISLTINPDGVFDHNRIGYCSNTFENLKINLLELIRNPDLRNEMGTNASKYARKYHSTKNADMLLDIFEKDV